MLNTVRIMAIGVSVLVIVGGLALFSLDPAKLEWLIGKYELPTIDFAEIVPEDPDDSYLLCPEKQCPDGAADALAPVFELSVTDLRSRLLQIVDQSPVLRTYRMDMDIQQFDFYEHTPGMRFPDLITVRLYARGESRSTLAVYSRGRSDEDVHKNRVRRWVAIMAPIE